MDFDLPGGKYVVAVSGGVDSVVLLHALLEKQRTTDGQYINDSTKNHTSTSVKQYSIGRTHRGAGYEVVVAHFDHGMRDDSVEDRRFVESLCKRYGVPCFYDNGHLGKDASEATARQARYDFLHRVRKATHADAIVTAHHQDDVLETIIMNMLRGTNNRGLHSLKSTDIVKRPLTHIPKRTIRTYATLHRLPWREDATNSDPKYLRNYVRHTIVPKLGKTNQQRLLKHGLRSAELQKDIDAHTARMLHLQPHTHALSRTQFSALPHNVSRELLASWLRQRAGVELSSKLLERLVVAGKTGRIDTEVDIAKGWRLHVSKDALELQHIPLVS